MRTAGFNTDSIIENDRLVANWRESINGQGRSKEDFLTIFSRYNLKDRSYSEITRLLGNDMHTEDTTTIYYYFDTYYLDENQDGRIDPLNECIKSEILLVFKKEWEIIFNVP